MLTAIALALSLHASPPVTRHYVLYTGGHATVTVHKRLRSWMLTRGGVVSIGDIHSRDKATTFRITASAPGATAITVGCDAGQEVWLVDVR